MKNKTLIIYNTIEASNEIIEDLIMYCVIAHSEKLSTLSPSDVQSRGTGRNFLVYVPNERMIELYKSSDIAELLADGFFLIQVNNRFEFFKEVINR
ncbi:MAG: hypothetical protein KGY70_11525 [Bacteroidales bacterium]|nr:hypothetical protein [Bacteroidales bacterium]